MEEININGEIFGYIIVNDDYVYINKYRKEEELGDEEEEYIINIPETIENLPVLGIDKLYIDDNPDDLDIIINLPEFTSFDGFQQVYTCFGIRTFSYDAQYYKRTDSKLMHIDGEVCCFSKQVDEESCEVIRIVMTNRYKVDNVWDPIDPAPAHTQLVIPGEINGLKVISLGKKCTLDLPETLQEIRFPDSIQQIGSECFNNLPFIENIYFGKNLETIGDNCFNFYEDTRDYYLKKVPALTVHCYRKPTYPETSFCRHANSRYGSDYSDWGWMQEGARDVEYEVVFITDQNLDG